MSARAIQPAGDRLAGPLVLSVVFHCALLSSLILSPFVNNSGSGWGSQGGGGAVTVGLVGSLSGVPLPRPETVTTNRVVDTSQGLYKAEPKPKEPNTAVEKVPEFKKEHQPRYVTRPSRTLEDTTPTPQNAVPYGQGGAPSVPYSQFTMAGATQGALEFGGPSGGDFLGRFPTYVDAVRNRISSNWLQSTVDPTVRWAPRVVFTFQILRDGSIVNLQKLQSSGNASVDNSALRAIQSSNPLARLPSEYSGSNVTVEFWFDFRR
ncbi:MAG TPA: TonB family protein [Methylomirabilota bacterium]|jgi:TonB family protein|nr:TonB family protein [Methylomirabilota bacterium]